MEEKESKLMGQQQDSEGGLDYIYAENPREYLHRFLLEARAAGCNVDIYIDNEIQQMLEELKAYELQQILE